ncbi:MAG: lipopolysaccharide kinase InaA family protein [Candidatus Binataceae bacterium]
MTRYLIYATSSEFAAAVGVDGLMAGAALLEVKRTARGRAGFIEIGGQRCFLKEASEGSYVKGLIARLRGSRARRILRGASMLAAAGFAHPRSLAAVEERRYGSVRSSWIASEALPDARVMSFFILGDGRNFRRRHWLSRLIAREVRRLHDAGLYTLDMQETNLMLEASGAELRIYFVDLEDFRRTRNVRRKTRMLNLVHLDRSIGRFASRGQRLRFLYNYLGGKPSQSEVREWVKGLATIKLRRDRRKLSDSGQLAIGRVHPEPVNPMRAATGKQRWRSRY